MIKRNPTTNNITVVIVDKTGGAGRGIGRGGVVGHDLVPFEQLWIPPIRVAVVPELKSTYPPRKGKKDTIKGKKKYN
jgi:hypothetical protein